MGENPFKVPTYDRILDDEGFLERVWKRFLANIETLSKRQAEPVAKLGAGTPTNDDLKTTVNALIDAMTNSDQMKSS